MAHGWFGTTLRAHPHHGRWFPGQQDIFVTGREPPGERMRPFGRILPQDIERADKLRRGRAARQFNVLSQSEGNFRMGECQSLLVSMAGGLNPYDLGRVVEVT